MTEEKTFSRMFENVFDQNYFESDETFKNVAIVGGVGEEAERRIAEVGEAEGIDRFEIFNDQRGLTKEEEVSEEDYKSLLTEKGKESLEENKKTITYDARIDYKDCHLGDVVLIIDERWKIRFTARIAELTKATEEEGLITSAKFGNTVPTAEIAIKQLIIQNTEKTALPDKIEGGYF